MSKTLGCQIAFPSLLACISVFGAAPAMAQQAASPATESAVPSSGTGALEEITVTSRKRTETLIQTPVAITAISAAEIENAGLKDLVDIANFTPGFEFEDQTINRNDRGYTEYSMRGMFPNSAFSGRANVQILVDGSSILGGHVPGLEDVGSVEVVKGPQSAYFGRSSFGGAVSFTTKMPYFDFGGDVNADIYTYGGRDLSASLNIPVVNDKLAVRASGRDYHTDGQYGNALNPGQKLGEQDTQSGALTALLTPIDNLSVKLYVTGWKDDDGQGATVLYEKDNCDTNNKGAPNYFCGILPLPSFPYGANPYPSTVSNVLFQNSANLRTLFSDSKLDHPGLDRIAYEAHANVQYTLDSGYTVNLVAAYDRDDFEVSDDLVLTPLVPGQGLYFRADESDRDANVEIRLASPTSDNLKWLVGADYYRIRTSNTTIGYIPAAGALQFNDVNLDNSDTYAVFGSASYEIIDGLTLSVEGRAQWDDIFAATVGGAANSAEFRSFTPRIILNYEFDPQLNAYFSYARGNRPGEFNSTITALDPRTLAAFEALTGAKIAVPEETVDMYEIGAKGLLFNDTLRVLAALYYGEWDNQHLQVNANVPNYAVAGAPLIGELADVAVGETVLYGVELESEYHPITELTIRGTYDIADTDIRKYSCINCITLTGFNDAIGNRLPSTPKYTGTVSVTYEAPVYNDIKGFIRGDMIWRGTSFESESNLAQTGESTIFNLQIGAETNAYRIAIYGKNITNDQHLLQVQYATSPLTGANAISASLALKPVFGIRGSYRF